jgi:hypothetical protein
MPCNRSTCLALSTALACIISLSPASAQAGGVNDCTLLTDPTLTRLCVERARQGGNARERPSSSQDAYSPKRSGASDKGADSTSSPTTSIGPKRSSADGRPPARDNVGPETRAEDRRQGKIP